MGRGSVRAAMIYQHRTADGNRTIVQAMDSKIDDANPDDDGAAGALTLVG
ncbi:hypothetical protein ABZ806_40655 [Spirillospora sp. NPDC047418]